MASHYTMQLRTLCEIAAGKTDRAGLFEVDEVLSKAIPKIFDPGLSAFYTLPDLPLLEEKILRHFYFHEIGSETASQFIFRLNERLREILPDYEKLYSTIENSASIFSEIDLTIRNTGTQKRDEKRNFADREHGYDSTSSSSADTMRSLDTPEGRIQNLDDGYLTKATKSDGSGKSRLDRDMSSERTGTGSNTRTDDLVETRKGKSGGKTYAELIRDYAKATVHIDDVLFRDLSSLFLLVY